MAYFGSTLSHELEGTLYFGSDMMGKDVKLNDKVCIGMEFNDVNNYFGGALGNPGSGTTITDSSGIKCVVRFSMYGDKYILNGIRIENPRVTIGEKPKLKP